ncbi:acyl-CoA N-acyltransferase [Suillus subaureus]|uniref:Acyl-CoA N-acyltransferase n=1 Tax=Suillus subaureus TaxID=48587 RepID=A0A9P7EAA8_9AGAM|nr:acyl-CoA N-acyltransferase [Suillus subaureus]KAG1815541.1 acyl-CoA N-acyltransferase [Suillus subaureus]
MAPIIRPATKADQSAISNICLLTANAGTSSKHLHSHPALPGLIYALPYLILESTWGFVLDDDGEVVGYTLGAFDTRKFEESAETDWWPSLKAHYGPLLHDSAAALTAADRTYINTIMTFPRASDATMAFAPAHLHIDILPSHQQQGWGRKLIARAMENLKENGVKSVWLGMDTRNTEAAAFYARLGFKKLEGAEDGIMGITVQEWEDYAV